MVTDLAKVYAESYAEELRITKKDYADVKDTINDYLLHISNLIAEAKNEKNKERECLFVSEYTRIEMLLEDIKIQEEDRLNEIKQEYGIR